MEEGGGGGVVGGGHGKVLGRDDPRQPGSQGALICQDWSGYGKVERDAYFDASDVPVNANVHGMVYFMFACYSGGCPQLDNFNRVPGSPKTIAPAPMMPRLPQALLAPPEGGALSVVAPAGRAWARSC